MPKKPHPPSGRSPYLTVTASAEMKQALQDYCKAQGVEYSDWVRRTLCTAIGRPELAANMRSAGRPWPKKPAKKTQKNPTQ